MIGIDIVEIERIEKMLERFGKRSLERYLTQEEQELIRSPHSAAGFWAVKEAVAKALGCGIGSTCGFKDIRIYKTQQGAPYIALSQRLIDSFGIESVEISITHDGGFAIAVAVLHTNNPHKVKGF